MGRDESVVPMTATRRRMLATVVVGLSGWLPGCGEDADGDETSGRPAADEDAPTDTASPTGAAGDAPTYADELSVTAADGYTAWGVDRSEAFVLEYEVVNRRSDRHEVDVLLYAAPTFESYRAVVTGEEGGDRPTCMEGSALGVASEVQRSVALDAGTYYLVVDNSGLGEGAAGTEETRRVRVEATVRVQSAAQE
jgi:hypothetical protein